MADRNHDHEPCNLAVKMEQRQNDIRTRIDKMEKLLVGNGDRTQSLMYKVDELYRRKRDWPVIIGYLSGIIAVLASIWAN